MTCAARTLAWPPPRCRPVPALRPLLAAALAVLAVAAQAQAPLTLVDRETTVKSVDFDFADGQTLLTATLELQIATTPEPGFIARRIGGDDSVHLFDPITVAKDAVRLQRYYESSGFPFATVDYAVELDTTDNKVEVTFLVEEGPPLLVERVAFAGPGQSDVTGALRPAIRDDWERFTRRTDVRPGDRLDALALLQLQAQSVAFLRNRGYAWADAGVEQFPDSTGLRADVRVKVNLGPVVRIGDVRVEGDSSLAPGVVTREVPVESGDLFNASALKDGQQELFSLGLFQLAIVEVAPEAVRGDTLVDVLVRVQRGPSKSINGFAGLFTDGGVTLRGGALHRNAFGGARQVSLNLEGRLGWPELPGSTQSVTGEPVSDYRASVTFRQPYVFDRRLSYSLQPSYRIRDDEIESSTTAEVSNSLLYTRGPLQTASLTLAGRRRDLSRGLGVRLLDAGRFAGQPAPFLPDSLRATTGGLGIDVVYGRLDNPLQPTRGFVVRPSLAVAGGDVSFGRARLAASYTRPLGRRSGIVSRVTVGAIRALGGTSPDDVGDYVLLRDQLFYAGGTSDVRGWGVARLGFKTFSVTPPVTTAGEIPDQTLITDPRDVNYVGVGGQAKASASVQLNLPIPAFGPQWGANVFLDAGQVWSPAAAATEGLVRAGGTPADSVLANILRDEGGVRFGTGAGIQYLTPIGFISFAVGVKINPSYLDERSAADVYCGSSINDDEPTCGGRLFQTDETPGYIDARAYGTTFDPEAIDGRFLNRIQFHISIGQTF